MSILILTELTMNANYIIRITQLIPTRLLSCILLNYERVALFSRVSLRVVSSQLSSRRLPYVFFHPTQGPIERQAHEKR